MKRNVPRRLLIVGLLLVIVIVGAIVMVRHMYYQNLKPVSNNPQTQIITIASGSSVKQIANQLAAAKLIHNSWVFEWYVHSNELGGALKAGTYAFSPNEGLRTIASTLTKGKVILDQNIDVRN